MSLSFECFNQSHTFLVVYDLKQTDRDNEVNILSKVMTKWVVYLQILPASFITLSSQGRVDETLRAISV